MKNIINMKSIKRIFYPALLLMLLLAILIPGVPVYADPADIDVGPAATDRASSYGSSSIYVTRILKDNPANATGVIKTVSVYVDSALTNFKVGIYTLVSGTTFKCRDAVTVGSLSTGLQTVNVNLRVVSGDYIGVTHLGNIDGDTTGTGLWYHVGDSVAINDSRSYTSVSGETLSVYAEGDDLCFGATSFPTTSNSSLSTYGPYRSDFNSGLGGRATSINVFVTKDSGTPTIKAALYNGDTLLGETGEVSVTAAGAQKVTLTFASPVAIPASTTIGIALTSSGIRGTDNLISWYHDNGAVGSHSYDTTDWPDFPSTWVADGSGTRIYDGYCVLDEYSGQPTVSTTSATNISFTTATVNGNITDFGTATSAAVTFEYGETTGYGDTATASESPVAGTGTVHADLSGLDAGTLYHFRVKVDADDTDPVYSDDATFTTLSQSPSVTTSAATGVTMDKDGVTGGTFNGNLTSLGDDTDADVSFIYGTTSACADDETTPVNVDATGAFYNDTEFPDNWTPGATYYYKSKATNTHGTSYGSVQSIVFTMPTFTTQAATYTSPGVATADLNGNISNMGVATGCYAYFEYGTSTSYGSSTTPQTFTIADDVEDTISGFLHNVTVHYRLVVEVGETTVNGNDETFLIAPNALAQVLWYQPIDIIHQVEGDWILPDRASTEDGIITWGTNPEGITVSNSLLISNGSIGVIGTNQHDAIPALNTDMTGTDTAQTGNILFSLFSPIATMTNFPLWILFTILGLVAIVLTMIYVTKHTQNQMLGAGAGLVITFLFYKIGVFDWWMFFIPVVMFAAILVMERKPSL